jgi:mono/diheme cytochrome c family protein
LPADTTGFYFTKYRYYINKTLYMKKTLVLLTILLPIFLLSFQQGKEKKQWNKDTPLQQVLLDLGEPKSKHYIQPTTEQIKKGEELVTKGWTTTPDGDKGKPVSKHYLCTTCHNIQREDPNLRIADPEARLPYVKEKNIPFVQGSTFWGIVNRETWYNDDYVKKYGDWKIERAHNDLRESIQLCAVECSQGRPMEEWEIEAVLAYYWTLDYKMKDLDLTDADWKKLREESQSEANAQALRTWLKTFYLQKSPATFYDAPPSKFDGYEGKIGRAEVGKDLYEISCLWCHNAENGVSHYVLDDSRNSFQHLKKMMFKDSHFSLYQIVAYGTYSIPGHKPYMPHYPEEKMSKQQVEDLRAYIELRAKGDQIRNN